MNQNLPHYLVKDTLYIYKNISTIIIQETGFENGIMSEDRR